MSLHVLAQDLAAKGRGNDKMLVHMTPREVKGLQALAMAHGGSLTVNPDTGLPEAGFLDAILPVVAGFALGPAGFALMSAPMATLTVGGITALTSGDLGKGLMAGLGAFGGANLGTALSTTGTQAAQSTAMMDEVARQAAEQAAAVNAQQTLAGTSLSAADGISQGIGAVTQAAPAPIMGTQAGADAILKAYQTAPVPTGLDSITAGVKDIGTPGGFSRFGSAFSQASGGPFGATLGTTGMVMPVASALQPTYEMPQVATAEPSTYEGPYVPTERTVAYPTAEERDTSKEFQYFRPSNPVPGYGSYYAAGGGLMDLAKGGTFDDEPGIDDRFAEGGQPEERGPVRMPGADYVAGIDPEFQHGFKPVQVQGAPDPNMGDAIVGKLFGNVPSSIGGKGVMAKLLRQVGGDIQSQLNPKDLENYKYDPQTQQLVKKAGGGLTALAGGRFLQGPGDGTSDSIPAVIANKQPARLADGEFVVDARTVSELGNGSSKAGAQKLYKMMDRVHNARKKAGRGKDSKAERFMPA